jgi:glycosyltransferase involved in cell wall biosynthesis
MLVNNKPPSTGIGVYASELFNHLLQIAPDRVRMLSLFDRDEDRSNLAFSRMARHLPIFWKLPRQKGRPLLHFLSANLGLGVVVRRPCMFTLWDLISFVPWLNKQRITATRGRDFPLLMGLRFNASLIKYSNLVVCPSQSTANDAREILKLDDSRIRVVYPGVNRVLFQPRPKLSARKMLGLPSDKKIILSISVDEPRKNLGTLLRSFKVVSDRHPQAVLVRIGTHTKDTDRLIHLLRIQDKIIQFAPPGRVSPLYYNAADVLCLPSLYEGVGFPLLESMSSGCPVVASNIASTSEILGDAGLTVDPLDVEGFARSLSELISSSGDTLVQGLVSKGLTRCETFDWTDCARKTYDLYQQVLAA